MNLLEHEDYRLLAMAVARLSEYGEACLFQASQAMVSLYGARHVPDDLLIADQVWQRSLPPTIERESGIVLQAALWTVKGFGIICWEAVEFWQYREQMDLTPYARERFKSIAKCNPIERALVAQCIQRLFENFRVKHESKPSA